MIGEAVIGFGVLAWLLAAAAILLGGNLTRSVMIGYAFIGCLCLTLLLAGAGFLAVIVSILSATALASIQVFGWMLVDVDHDHLKPTDGPTWVARVLAVALLGGGLTILVVALSPELVSRTAAISLAASTTSAALGRALFGPLGGGALLLGLTIAAGLLATMLLLRDENGEGS